MIFPTLLETKFCCLHAVATSAFGLGRRGQSSPQWCYLHHLHAIYAYILLK